MKRAGVLLIVAVAGYHFFIKETWIAFYYPDKDNLITYERSPELSSYQECLDWVSGKADMYNATGFDWECGRDCDYSASSDIYWCKETIR